MASKEDLVSSGGSVFSSELLKTFLHQARYNNKYGNSTYLSTLLFNFNCIVRKIWKEFLVLTPSRATLQQQFSSMLHQSLNRQCLLPLSLPPAAPQPELELY